MKQYEKVKRLLDLKAKIEKVDGEEFTMSGVSSKLWRALVGTEEIFINGTLPRIINSHQALNDYIVDGEPLTAQYRKFYKLNKRCDDYRKIVNREKVPCKIRVYRNIYSKKEALKYINQYIKMTKNMIEGWLDSAIEQISDGQRKFDMHTKTLALFEND